MVTGTGEGFYNPDGTRGAGIFMATDADPDILDIKFIPGSSTRAVASATLNISASKIDTNLMFSGSVWWEPSGDDGPAGKSRDMYDDHFASDEMRIRIGSSFTRSREDRFSESRSIAS